MDERTEEQILSHAGIEVKLGGEKYTIRPLAIRYSREWRQKSLPLIGFLMSYGRLVESGKSGNSEEIQEAVTELFTTKTDEIIESFFEYARGLSNDEKERIENTATDGEIIVAFMEVFDAFVAPLSVSPARKKAERDSPSEEPSSSS